MSDVVENDESVEPVKSADLAVGDLASILALDDTVEEWVDVPEWKCKVKIKSMTKAEQIKVRRMSTGKRGNFDDAKFEGLLFVSGVVEPAFTPEHLPALMQKNGGAVTRVINRILVINGMADDVAEDDEETFQD